MQVSQATLSIWTLFASLDIYHSSSLNSEVQKQNEIYIKNFKQNLLTQ